MAARKTPQTKSKGDGRWVAQVEFAERRAAAARMRSRGHTWQEVADKYFRGDTANAVKYVKQHWAEIPRETVEEVRLRQEQVLGDAMKLAYEVAGTKHY